VDQSSRGARTAVSIRDPDTIRQEIAETREELGDAVEELAAKTDVKARMREQLTELRHSAAQLPDRARERPAVTVAVATTAIALIVLARR
jgi:phage shock protein A